MSKSSSKFEREFLRLIHLGCRSVNKRLNIMTRFGFQVEGGAGHRASLTVKQVSNMIEMKINNEISIDLVERALEYSSASFESEHG
jgi:hypothetical protein